MSNITINTDHEGRPMAYWGGLAGKGETPPASPCSAGDEWSDLPPEIAELFRNTPPLTQEQLDRLAEANRKIFAEIAAEEAAKQNAESSHARDER